jgi:hypothetical protein
VAMTIAAGSSRTMAAGRMHCAAEHLSTTCPGCVQNLGPKAFPPLSVHWRWHCRQALVLVRALVNFLNTAEAFWVCDLGSGFPDGGGSAASKAAVVTCSSKRGATQPGSVRDQ